jgi:hypothetical protein
VLHGRIESMLDIVQLLAVAGFFALCAGVARGLEALMEGGPR